DLGYAIGALLAGLIADAFGLAWSIRAASALTFLSGVVVWQVMRETRNRQPDAPEPLAAGSGKR
ncbi:MAG: hypothetical protein HYY04_08215, partial [Chloroflexi bacterium]|nr:hypothetical protein [Chloroflexota bacterium]